jgi:dTDP-4-dehydrorhamnose reductase
MILLTGGSGLLGRHLKVPALRPSHKEFDILEPKKLENIELIIHCAAYTDTEKAEAEREECFMTNVVGTLRLSSMYRDVPLVYISSEYAHNPVNWYSRTKQIAEAVALDHPGGCLAIRTLFKARPWKYEYAFIDKWTLGDYVDVIAEKIEKEIKDWDGKTKLIYVGTGRKTYFDLASETKVNVKPNSIRDIKGVKIPSDYK